MKMTASCLQQADASDSQLSVAVAKWKMTQLLPIKMYLYCSQKSCYEQYSNFWYIDESI